MAGLPVSRQRLSMELQRNEVMEDSWCDFGECVRSEIESFFCGKGTKYNGGYNGWCLVISVSYVGWTPTIMAAIVLLCKGIGKSLRQH